MSHDFEEIEDAVIAALTPLKSQGLKALDTYSGQVEVDWEDLKTLIFQFPCIYVIASNIQLNWNNRVDKYQIRAALIVGDKNLRGSRAAARGDQTSPGVYEMLRLSREKLHNKELLSGWSRFYLTTEAPLVYMPKEGVCLYAAQYEARAMK